MNNTPIITSIKHYSCNNMEAYYPVGNKDDATKSRKVRFTDETIQCNVRSNTDGLIVEGSIHNPFSITITTEFGQKVYIPLTKNTPNYDKYISDYLEPYIVKNHEPRDYNFNSSLIDEIFLESKSGNIIIAKNISESSESDVTVVSYTKPEITNGKLSLSTTSKDIKLKLPEKFIHKKISVSTMNGKISTENDYIIKTTCKLETMYSDIQVTIDGSMEIKNDFFKGKVYFKDQRQTVDTPQNKEKVTLTNMFGKIHITTK